MSEQNFNVIWLTGMSGSGKSTLAAFIKSLCEEYGFVSKVIDGDEVRNKDEKKLGFSYEDVLTSNLRIAQYCLDLKISKINVVIVPVISPYEEIRTKIARLLSGHFHLIYVKTDIDSLRKRDTKGLYLASDLGKINNLIGYSETNPYEPPLSPSITINTGEGFKITESKKEIQRLVNSILIHP